MPKLREGSLGEFTSATAGSAVNVESLSGLRCLVSGTFVADIDIEVSFDQGTTWQVFQQLTAPGLSNELPPCGRVRANCSAYTSGTATVGYGGRDEDRSGL